MVVVFPAPLCPNKAVIWPSLTSKSVPSTATFVLPIFLKTWNLNGSEFAVSNCQNFSNSNHGQNISHDKTSKNGSVPSGDLVSVFQLYFLQHLAQRIPRRVFCCSFQHDPHVCAHFHTNTTSEESRYHEINVEKLQWTCGQLVFITETKWSLAVKGK